MSLLAFVTWYLLNVPELRLEPTIATSASLLSSDHITAGGVGGTLGVQLIVQDRWLAELQAGPLFLLGNALVTRAAVGAQLRVSSWTPAVWLRFSALWGARIEVLDPDGSRPARPTCSLGLGLSPLRYSGSQATLSLLEPGIGLAFGGGISLELTLMQLGAHF